MKRKIRLTESQLHNIICENIKSVINEEYETYQNDNFFTFYSEICRKVTRVQTSLSNIQRDLRKFCQNSPEPIDNYTKTTLQNYSDELEKYQTSLDNLCDNLYDTLCGNK